MRHTLLLSILSTLILSCQSKEISHNPIYVEVMAIHDKVMPETSTLHKLKMSLKAVRNGEKDSIILSQIMKIEKADEQMMQWMEKFEPSEHKSDLEAYLQQQKTEIQQVSENIYQTIESSNALLTSLKVE